MTGTHPPYPEEFRRRMIQLVRAGRTPLKLAKEFQPSAQTIRNWVKQAHLDQGLRDDGLTTTQRDALLPLRRENRSLKEERQILKKAAAWFARETISLPDSSLSS
jgi:transposase